VADPAGGRGAAPGPGRRLGAGHVPPAPGRRHPHPVRPPRRRTAAHAAGAAHRRQGDGPAPGRAGGRERESGIQPRGQRRALDADA
jgi:hypothetical protein